MSGKIIVVHDGEETYLDSMKKRKEAKNKSVGILKLLQDVFIKDLLPLVLCYIDNEIMYTEFTYYYDGLMYDLNTKGFDIHLVKDCDTNIDEITSSFSIAGKRRNKLNIDFINEFSNVILLKKRRYKYVSAHTFGIERDQERKKIIITQKCYGGYHMFEIDDNEERINIIKSLICIIQHINEGDTMFK